MNRVVAGAMAVGAMALAGCASTAETEAYQKRNRAVQTGEQETLVGSRLVKPTTERTVNVVGSQEYSELNQHTGIANRVSSPGN